MATDLKDFSSPAFKVVGTTHERKNFSFSFISIDLTEDVGVGAARTNVTSHHCYFIVDHW